ncbi:MAG: ATP-binding protein [Mariprofundus sp.]|nr:ATP-binding protein [Mariprofundus sp.]
MLNTIPEGAIVVGQHGRLLFANQRAALMLGYEAGELKGMDVQSLVPDFLFESHMNFSSYDDKQATNCGDQWCRFSAVGKDGRDFPVRISSSRCKIAGKNSVMLAVEDLTEQTRLEEKSSHSQKLEMLGEMVGGIVHNFNNLLSGITGQSYLLQNDCDLNASAVTRMHSIDALCQKSSSMIRKLMAYSRDDSVEYCHVDAIAMLHDALELARITLPKQISLNVLLEDQPIQLWCDAGEIQQAVMNMINNASHAIACEGAGEITIDAKRCDIENCDFVSCPRLLSRRDNAAKSVFCVKVKDSGSGIPEAVMKSVFEPFFTTKPAAEGTGLGLSTALASIKQMGGHMMVRNRAVKGAEVVFFLPEDTKRSSAAQVCAQLPQAQQGKAAATILLIDDEKQLLGLLKEIVEGAGFKAICAENGAVGVELFTRHADEIGLVISDICMPVMDGVEALERIHALRADLPCIYLTGYSEQIKMMSEHSVVVMKPFNIADLNREINQALGVSEAGVNTLCESNKAIV